MFTLVVKVSFLVKLFAFRCQINIFTIEFRIQNKGYPVFVPNMEFCFYRPLLVELPEYVNFKVI
jgi:hypothetical protein